MARWSCSHGNWFLCDYTETDLPEKVKALILFMQSRFHIRQSALGHKQAFAANSYNICCWKWYLGCLKQWCTLD